MEVEKILNKIKIKHTLFIKDQSFNYSIAINYLLRQWLGKSIGSLIIGDITIALSFVSQRRPRNLSAYNNYGGVSHIIRGNVLQKAFSRV